MVLSSFSFAFAANFEDVEGDYEDAINTLVALGVVTGYEDGTFKPERVVTRAEMAKLIVEILGYGDLVAGSKSNFADTQGHWADPWIALAAGRGLVIGTGDGKFTPDRTVSYDEAITMIVRALGYTDDCNELKNMTWPTNFKVKAAELGLTKNVALNAAGADRGGVAILLYNALEAELVTVNTDGDVVFSGKELLSRLAELDEDYVVSSELFDPTNKNYAGDMVDLAPYIYQSLKVYLNDDDEVVYIKDSNSLVIEGEIDEVTLSKSGKVATVAIETADGSIKKLDFTVDEDEGLDTELPGSVFENRASKSEATFKYLNDKPETVKIVANEGDKSNGKIEEDEVVGFVLETQTKVARVEEEYEDGDDKFDVFTLPTNSKDEPNFNKIIVKGDADSLEDIEVDDVVVEYLAEDDAFTTLVVSRDTVEGEVTRIGGTDVYVDGTKYKVSTTEGAEDGILLGDKGIFFLDHNGKIVAFDGEGGGATDYAVVLGVEPGEIDDDRFGKVSIDEYPQLKVVTQAGEEVIYDVYAKVAKKDGKIEITDSAKYVKADGTVVDLFEKEDVTESDTITNDTFTGLNPEGKEYKVIKIKLNSDDKITRLETVEAKDIEIDTTKSSFKLASGALIFDIDEEEAVSESKLDATVEGYAVYNKNGQIEVLLTNSVDGYNYTFAYITKAEGARQNGENVQALVAYVNGKKVDPLYTDDDDVVTDGTNKVYALDLGDDDIVKEAKVTTVSGLKFYGERKATGVSNSNRTIQLSGAGWLNVAEDATIIGVDGKGDVEAIRKLSSIVKNESVIDVYYYDSEVVFIVIYEDYDEESDVPDPDPATGEVTYKNADASRIEVDGTIYKLDADTILYKADGTIAAVGNVSIEPLLTPNVTKVEAIKVNKDGFVESFKLVAPEVVDTTLVVKDADVVLALNNTTKTIKVEYNTTVGELKAAIATNDANASFKVLLSGVEVADTVVVPTTGMTVKVTGKDGTTTATYTVTANPGTATGITITDRNIAQLSGTTIYLNKANVTAGQLLAVIKTDDPKATVKAVDSSSVELAANHVLVLGDKIVVTAQDGTTSATYTLNFTNVPSPNSGTNIKSKDLNVATVSGTKVIFADTFNLASKTAAEILAYVEPATAADAGATMKVLASTGGVEVAPNATFRPGMVIEVTAENGTATANYTITSEALEELDAAKIAVETTSNYSLTVAAHNTEPAAKAYVEGVVNGLTEVSGKGFTVTVTTVSHIPGVASTTDGSYVFRVTLAKAGFEVTTSDITVAIAK